jgi:hypothetical protein
VAQAQPSADGPDLGDLYVRLGTTFGGAAVIRGGLTPQVRHRSPRRPGSAGQEGDPEHDAPRTISFHDALQVAWRWFQFCVMLGV